MAADQEQMLHLVSVDDVVPLITVFSSNSSEQDADVHVNKKQGGAEHAHNAFQIPFSDRKKNWIIRCLPRGKSSACDSYYVHLQSDKQFRSLNHVHAFVVHGRLPEPRIRNKEKKEKLISNSGTEKSTLARVTGDKLLDRVSVGYHNFTKGEIFRCDGGGTKLVKIGKFNEGTKRKRNQDVPNFLRKKYVLSQEVAEVIRAAQNNTPNDLIYPLYDFEPLN